MDELPKCRPKSNSSADIPLTQAEELEKAKRRMQRYKLQLDESCKAALQKKPQKHTVSTATWLIFAHFMSALLVLAVYQDWYINAFGTSNGRFISFMDGLNTCYQYRLQKAPRLKGVQGRQRSSSFYHASLCVDKKDGIRITAGHFFIKFGMSTCVSILLGAVDEPRFCFHDKHILHDKNQSRHCYLQQLKQ